MAENIITERKSLRMSDRDGLYLMSEGNPGALTVISQAAQEMEAPDQFLFLINLDDINIRGSQIWVAYKDVCKFDLQQLVERVAKRDPSLVAAINSIIPDGERAVEHGASFAHR